MRKDLFVTFTANYGDLLDRARREQDSKAGGGDREKALPRCFKDNLNGAIWQIDRITKPAILGRRKTGRTSLAK